MCTEIVSLCAFVYVDVSDHLYTSHLQISHKNTHYLLPEPIRSHFSECKLHSNMYQDHRLL